MPERRSTRGLRPVVLDVRVTTRRQPKDGKKFNETSIGSRASALASEPDESHKMPANSKNPIRLDGPLTADVQTKSSRVEDTCPSSKTLNTNSNGPGMEVFRRHLDGVEREAGKLQLPHLNRARRSIYRFLKRRRGFATIGGPLRHRQGLIMMLSARGRMSPTQVGRFAGADDMWSNRSRVTKFLLQKSSSL